MNDNYIKEVVRDKTHGHQHTSKERTREERQSCKYSTSISSHNQLIIVYVLAMCMIVPLENLFLCLVIRYKEIVIVNTVINQRDKKQKHVV